MDGFWKKGKNGKIMFTEQGVRFLKENFKQMTNRELASALGLKLTIVRTRMYELGLKRMEMEYWTPEQVQFLRDNYREMGDVEIAEIFQETSPKEKPWTNKHIDKKRDYLNLKRTAAEIKEIKKMNIANGRFSMCVAKRWETVGTTPVGEIRVWKHSGKQNGFAVIKRKNGFVHYNRWLYQQHFGKLKSDQLVVTVSGDTIARGPEDLLVIDREEHARRCVLKKYPEEYRETVKLIWKLNEVITEKSNKK